MRTVYLFAALFGTLLVLTTTRPLAAAPGGVQVEAVPGRPFGVATITLPPNAEVAAAAELNNFAITERNGRALYPVFTQGRVRKILGELLGADLGNMPATLTVSFLFTGDEPLQLTVLTPSPVQVDVVPRLQNERFYERLMTQWWRDYNAAVRQQLADEDYPPIVQTYLTSMLANRLRLEPPFLSKLAEKKPTELQQSLELLMGSEGLQAATMKDTMLRGAGLGVAADRPLPPDINWGARMDRPFDPGVVIEPMAMHVPENCFYIRYGRYSNRVWFDHLSDDYGGDLANMATLRGMKTDGDLRTQRQLALKDSWIGDLVGDALIADVAMVGHDLYVEEGAAFGMMFQAQKTFLGAKLGSNFTNERATTLAEEKKNGATMETVKIAGHDVSFLSTPDNGVRSYYAVDGDFHFFSTSRKMIEEFYAVSSGQGALGNTAEFKHARTQMPTSNDYTVFVYFSSAFFRNLVSPQYQIELTRRMQSLTDMQLVQLAQLAARAERRPADTLEDLIAADLLPRGFGRRPDGSGPIVAKNGMVDSLRGPVGGFTPIPDIAIKAVTQDEAAACARRSAFYESQWKQMDPLMVGVKRFALDTKPNAGAKEGEPAPRVERIVLDGNVPYTDDSKYGKFMSVLGAPTAERIAPDPNDIISVQANVKGGLLFPSISQHHLFVGIQDSVPVNDMRASGLMKTLRILQTTPGYLGAWPKMGFLDILPLGLVGGQPDSQGYTQMLLGLWRRQWGAFSALSFQRRVLDNVTPGLHPEMTDSEAQIRIHAGDLARSQLSVWVNSLYYDRARQASVGNIRFLHAISQQLQVPREEARTVAEKLMNMKLVCTLGGELTLTKGRSGANYWTSTKMLADGQQGVPNDFRAPILDWFRGLDASLIKFDDRLLVHAQLDMQRKASEPKIELPLFSNFFGGGGGDKKTEKTPEAPPAKNEVLPAPAPAGTNVPKKTREF